MKPLGLVLAGVALGFGLGWLVFDVGQPPAPRTTEDDRPIEERPVRKLFPGVEPRIAVSPSEATDEFAEPPPEKRTVDVDALLRDVAAARSAGDERAFFLAVRALSSVDDERAQQRLLELMADTEIPLPTPLGTMILTGLARSRLPGIAPTARRRFEANVEAGETSWVAARGWLGLVAIHGNDVDLDWLLDLSESTQIVNEARRALASSDSPAAIARSEALLTRNPDDVEYLQQFASIHPARALPFIERRLRESPDSLYGALYGNSVPEVEIERAKAVLLGMREPGARLVAAYAVDRLKGRGLDVAGLETILLAPAEVLEQASPATDRVLLRRAAQVLANCQSTWSERSLTAVISATRSVADPETVAHLGTIEKKMRAKLRGPRRER